MKAKKLIGWIIPLFWGFVIVLMTFQDYVSSELRNTSFYLSDSLVFKIKYVLYIAVTFLILRTLRWLPLRSPQLMQTLLVHLLISLIVSIVILLVASLVMAYLWQITGSTTRFENVLMKMLSTSFFNEILNYWLILGLFHGLTVYEEYQQTKLAQASLERQLSETRLNALKMQLQPHFLFNTHHNIIGLMQQNDTPKAIKMLMKLSDLLRLSLKENASDLVPLSQEMTFLGLYLDILKIRFEERLSVHIQVEEGLENVLIPPMILQPLVENAVKYGIEPFAKKGVIEIEALAKPSKKYVKISIKDNGIENQSIGDFRLGVGLTNTQNRLRSVFGKEAELSIFSNEPQSGISVEIVVPLLKTPLAK